MLTVVLMRYRGLRLHCLLVLIVFDAGVFEVGRGGMVFSWDVVSEHRAVDSGDVIP